MDEHRDQEEEASSTYRLLVWGDWACFPRPQFSVDLVTYDVLTPYAARAILESIHWRPPVRWQIRRILVLNPVEVTPHPASGIDSTDPRVLALKDVAYVIEARLLLVDGTENLDKHRRRFERRVSRNRPFRRPYFGVRECPAEFRLLTDYNLPTCAPELLGERDWGWLPYDQEDERRRPTRFLRAHSKDGVITVPSEPCAALFG